MTAPDFETDHAAIITAIEGECAAYFAKDFDLWARFWVQAAPIRRWNWHADVGMTFHAGWEQESRSIGDGMRRFPSPMVNDVRRDWLHFVISADLAWVTFDQHSASAGDPFQVTGRQHEMRIMQKCAGRWLTACVSSLKPRAEIAPCPLIRVDATGRVIAMNAHAMARLQGHPGLIAVNDRLRARNRATDRALQAAIVWASGALGYAQKRMSQRDTAATGGAVPVLDTRCDRGPGGPVLGDTCRWDDPCDL